jgi:DNA-binding transcriptional MocR family regulator
MAVMRQFPATPITALIDSTPRYNLGESMGPDLTVAELGPADLASVSLGYGTSPGDPALRMLVAARLAICGVRLDPAKDPERFHAELSRRQTLVARGPWFHDSPHVFRLGFGYEPLDRLELALDEISQALQRN